MKKWVCQNDNTHVFNLPSEDGYCTICPNHEGVLVEIETGPIRDPLIKQFYTSKNKVRNEEHFTLTWDVENADKIELYKNDLLIKLNADQRSIDLRDYFDDNKTQSKYILVACNNSKEVKSEAIIIRMLEPGKATLLPVIDRFYTNKNKVKSEESFTLSWEVKNADKIELYKDNVLIQLSADQKSIDLKDYYHDDKEYNSYVLVAYNDDGEIKSEPIIIALTETNKVIEKPAIDQFYASKTKIQNGEHFTLSWDVKNANKVELYRNNILVTLNTGQKVIDFSEFFDGSNNEHSYMLIAFNGDIQTKSNVIIIGLAENKNTAEIAVINKFYADKTRVKNGARFTLSWDVENADSIELYKNGILIKLNTDQKAINLSETFDDSKKDNNYLLIACKNSIETKSDPIIISLDKTQRKFPVLLVVLAGLIVIFVVYKFITHKSKVKFFVSEKLMYKDSDLKIHTENLRDTIGLQVLFNGIAGQKNSFTATLLLVKVPQISGLSPGDSVVLSVMRRGKQLYQTRLAYIANPVLLHIIPHPDRPVYRPVILTYRGTPVTHNLVSDQGNWGQSTAAYFGHLVTLSWKGSSTLEDGSAGTGFLQMEDGLSYTVLYARPNNQVKSNSIPDTIKGSFYYPGSNGKIFTAKIGFFKGGTNANASFEIWANNEQGALVLIKQYRKVYDGKIIPIYLQFSQTSSTNFKMQLRIAGNGFSIGSAAWIEPKVMVDQLNINYNRAARKRHL